MSYTIIASIFRPDNIINKSLARPTVASDYS